MFRGVKVQELVERLANYGQEVDALEVTKAVEAASQNFREREGHWPSSDNDMEWDYLQYNALETLGIDHDLVGL